LPRAGRKGVWWIAGVAPRILNAGNELFLVKWILMKSNNGIYIYNQLNNVAPTENNVMQMRHLKLSGLL
jgi:hypothetical protein